MTYVLGLTGPVSFDQAAVLVEDGSIVAAAEEERFTGVKHQRYGPPINAVKYCLGAAGIKASELDSVAVGWGTRGYWTKSILKQTARRPYMALNAPSYYRDMGKYWGGDFIAGYTGKIFHHRHHLTHSASAFYCSGYERANILIIDECGETESTTLGVGAGEEIEIVESFDYANSIGRLYRQFTEYLGFAGHSDEYKVMGLAAYGKPLQNTGHLLQLTKGGYTMETGHFYRSLIRTLAKTTDRMLRPYGRKLDPESYLNMGPGRKDDEPITARHENIAATAQSIYEQTLIHLAEILHERTGYKKFTIAGGCGLNCSANGKLLLQDYVDDIFIQPASSDAGSALGAALLEASKTHNVKKRLTDVGLGPEYPNEEIEKELKKTDLKYERCDDIEAAAAELLSEDKIIGWFQGRMEFGPRALGYRSILANPMKSETRDRVNRVKSRELWRPLAPSILEESLPDYFDIRHINPFMTVTQTVKDEKRAEIPAVVHVDGTTRYQTVDKEHGRYRKLIELFGKESGTPVILNTSFNGRGQPIVTGPGQAADAAKTLGLDALAAGGCIVYL
jgi:carbamoyltransferase